MQVRARAVHDAQRCAELAGAMKARLDERINAFTDTLFPEVSRGTHFCRGSPGGSGRVCVC
jgi:hypothetical protein